MKDTLSGEGDDSRELKELVQKNYGVVNQARFELFQYLRRYCMQVQVSICTSLILITAMNAKDYFLDATAVLFLLEVDNLLFRALATSSEQEFYLETTKVHLDEIETQSLQLAKVLHGGGLSILMISVTICVKSNGFGGRLRSIAEVS